MAWLTWGKFGGASPTLRKLAKLEVVIMETAELKSAISELSARIDKIRDWL